MIQGQNLYSVLPFIHFNHTARLPCAILRIVSESYDTKMKIRHHLDILPEYSKDILTRDNTVLLSWNSYEIAIESFAKIQAICAQNIIEIDGLLYAPHYSQTLSVTAFTAKRRHYMETFHTVEAAVRFLSEGR